MAISTNWLSGPKILTFLSVVVGLVAAPLKPIYPGFDIAFVVEPALHALELRIEPGGHLLARDWSALLI
jgi:hypothetical protein